MTMTGTCQKHARTNMPGIAGAARPHSRTGRNPRSDRQQCRALASPDGKSSRMADRLAVSSRPAGTSYENWLNA